MTLIGMLDSPFVRRVAIAMDLCGLQFERLDWSVGRDFARIREFSPLGRVPALVLDGGEVLVESSAILDYIDERVGTQQALMPARGAERRDALGVIALAVGAAEKGREQIYENAFRPAEKRHEPWIERCRSQMHGALGELDRRCALRGDSPWLVAARMTHADIAVAVITTFLADSPVVALDTGAYPALRAFVARCEALPAFRATHVPWFAPQA
ncbi:MAG: glutathione S-transferase family protein [Steroidobacteraceae bacterium]